MKKIKRSTFFSTLVKVFVFITAAYFLALLIQGKKEWFDELQSKYTETAGLRMIGLMLLLMLVNSSLEAFKWKRLIGSIDSISFTHALMAVFSGISAGLITPHSVGDYIGRILFLKKGHRLNGIGSVLFSRISQLIITCSAGILASVYFLARIEFNYWILASAAAGIITIGMTVIAWSYRAMLFEKIRHIIFLRRIVYWFDVIRSYDTPLFFQTLLLSFLRYVVFLSQFVLLLMFFDIDLPVHTLVAGGVFTFFIKSVVPTFFELGVRELAAVYFFSQYGMDKEHVLLASLSLWFFNMIIPAFLGLFCIFKIER